MADDTQISADRCKQCRLKAESHYESAYKVFALLSDSSSLELLRLQLERVALSEHQYASKTVSVDFSVINVKNNHDNNLFVQCCT